MINWLLGDDPRAECPVCGEPIIQPTRPDGYREYWCERCAQATARRRDLDVVSGRPR